MINTKYLNTRVNKYKVFINGLDDKYKVFEFKDNIVNDLYGQLGIKSENIKIIEKNKDKGLIYVLQRGLF